MIAVKVRADVHDNDTTEKKRKRWLVIAVVLALLMLAASVLLAWFALRGEPNTGSRIVLAGDLPLPETQAMVDEIAQKSRITVSLAPALKLGSDEDSVRVNFIVAPGNNGFAERFEINQDQRVIYRSEAISPGSKVEWARAPGIHEGAAVVTVYAVDDAGGDCGNPVSVEVEVEQTRTA